MKLTSNQQQPIRSELRSDTSPASPISEYNPPKQYWQAGSIILYEWCYNYNIFFIMDDLIQIPTTPLFYNNHKIEIYTHNIE